MTGRRRKEPHSEGPANFSEMPGKRHPRNQPLRLSVKQLEASFRLLDQRAHNRQSQPKSDMIIHVAGRFAAHEGFQDRALSACGYSGAIILDIDLDKFREGCRRVTITAFAWVTAFSTRLLNTRCISVSDPRIIWCWPPRKVTS